MATPALHDELRVRKGTVIFRQGDPGDEMFVVSEGRVRLTLGSEGHEREIGIFEAGEFFGELSLLSGSARSATAEAIEDSTLLAIGRDVFAMMVQDDLGIVFRMMHIQGQRLSLTNLPIQELMRRLARIRVATHAVRSIMRANGQWPVTLDLHQLMMELEVSVEMVREAATALVESGAGELEGHRWLIRDQTQMDKLLDVTCTLADGRTV